MMVQTRPTMTYFEPFLLHEPFPILLTMVRVWDRLSDHRHHRRRGGGPRHRRRRYDYYYY